MRFYSFPDQDHEIEDPGAREKRYVPHLSQHHQIPSEGSAAMHKVSEFPITPSSGGEGEAGGVGGAHRAVEAHGPGDG